MKKLIAQRPILYMGRTYERGDTIPAHDPKMVAAWLRAKSAAWSGQESRQDPPARNTPGAKTPPWAARTRRRTAKTARVPERAPC